MVLAVVDADPTLDGDGNGSAHGRDHRRDAGRDEFRLAHQAGAEAATLDTFRRAAAVQVDLVIAVLGADRGCAGEVRWVAPAELQGYRVLRRTEPQMAHPVAVQDGAAVHHLGVEQRVRRQ